jgi:hypothetical protein
VESMQMIPLQVLAKNVQLGDFLVALGVLVTQSIVDGFI